MTVTIVKNFISEDIAKEIISLSRNTLRAVDSRPGFYEDPHKRSFLPEDAAYKENVESGQDEDSARAGAKISSMLYKIKQFLEESSGTSLPNGEGGLARLTEGAFNGLHSDMYQIDGSKWEDGSGRESELDYSALLYLSDFEKDFTGGEIIFPQQDLTIKPECGMLIFFRGDLEHLHKVSRVTSGERHSIVAFLGGHV